MEKQNILHNKAAILLTVLAVFFVVDALTAEFLGVKIFSLENSLKIKPFNWNLFGQSGSLNFTAGVIMWPIVFIMTDIINEYFGAKGVRRVSYLAVIFISYGFIASFIAIRLSPAEFWTNSYTEQGVPDMQSAYSAIFGQGMWIIVGSLTAFVFGQLVDVFVFHKVKKITGEKNIWLRATGSTVVSQIFDSLIVLYIAFVVGPQHWSIGLWLAVATVNYCYKIFAAIILTPVLYIIHGWIEKYLGHELAEELRNEAMKS